MIKIDIIVEQRPELPWALMASNVKYSWAYTGPTLGLILLLTRKQTQCTSPGGGGGNGLVLPQ